MCHRKADNLLLFKSIVDAGSLSTAARVCNISVSQVSKRMAYLENTLGIQLLQRTTRKLALTHPGEILYQKLNAIKQQIDEAWQSALEYGNAPRGEMHIAAPMTYGTNQLMAIVKAFNQTQPQIHVNLELINSEQPLEASNYDIHFQSHIMSPGQLIPDSNLSAREVAADQLVFVASQEYLTQHGVPTKPEELNQHKCLAIKSHKIWNFYQADATVNQVIDEVAFITNDLKAIYNAAKAGMGIAQIPRALLKQDDDLVTLFTDYTTDTLHTYAYYQANHMSSKKVSLFLAQLLEEKHDL